MGACILDLFNSLVLEGLQGLPGVFVDLPLNELDDAVLRRVSGPQQHHLLLLQPFNEMKNWENFEDLIL